MSDDEALVPEVTFEDAFASVVDPERLRAADPGVKARIALSLHAHQSSNFPSPAELSSLEHHLPGFTDRWFTEVEETRKTHERVMMRAADVDEKEIEADLQVSIAAEVTDRRRITAFTTIIVTLTAAALGALALGSELLAAALFTAPVMFAIRTVLAPARQKPSDD